MIHILILLISTGIVYLRLIWGYPGDELWLAFCVGFLIYLIVRLIMLTVFKNRKKTGKTGDDSLS